MPAHSLKVYNCKISEEYTEERARDSLHAVIRIKTPNGWKTVDSPFDPVREAVDMLDNAGEGDADYIVLGAGSGFTARELRRRNARNCLVITGAGILARKNKTVLSDTGKGCGSFTILCSTTADDYIFNSVREFLEKHPAARIAVHTRETKVFPSLFNPLLAFIEYLRHPLRKKTGVRPKKIVFPAQGHICEPDLQEEMLLRGIEVIPEASFAHSGIDHKQAWSMLCRHEPDMVFSINNRGADRNGFIPESCMHAGIIWATWFLDQPRFLVAEHEARYPQRRFAFCWDSAGMDPCRELGFETVELLPLGTNHRVFTPGPGQGGLDGRIVYVGSPSFGNENNYFAALRSNRNAELVAGMLQQTVIQSRLLPTRQEIRKVLDALHIDEQSFSSEELRRLPAYVLYKANLAYRIAALQSIADLSPVVYGDGWDGLLKESVELRPYADYYRDLPAIYRSDAVHLSLTHLQMRRYPNQRIFDIGACGRAVLGERLSGCDELFGGDFRDLFFDDFSQLHDRAVMLLENKKLRAGLGADLRTVVLRQHTVAHRLDRILDCIHQTRVLHV